jgi:hypothetical protein
MGKGYSFTPTKGDISLVKRRRIPIPRRVQSNPFPAEPRNRHERRITTKLKQEKANGKT